jgi:hypothetical protein
MKKLFLISPLIAFIFFSSCVDNETESKLISFEYGGFGDTIFAFLSGNVYDGEENVPLENVRISFKGTTDTSLANIYSWCENFYPKDTLIQTDSNGYFQMAFFSGNIAIVMEKEGYGTLELRNYKAVPDQYSHMKAILNLGDERTKIDIEENN